MESVTIFRSISNSIMERRNLSILVQKNLPRVIFNTIVVQHQKIFEYFSMEDIKSLTPYLNIFQYWATTAICRSVDRVTAKYLSRLEKGMKFETKRRITSKSQMVHSLYLFDPFQHFLYLLKLFILILNTLYIYFKLLILGKLPFQNLFFMVAAQ